jgi:acid phosphatase family membrane protein YuiD
MDFIKTFFKAFDFFLFTFSFLFAILFNNHTAWIITIAMFFSNSLNFLLKKTFPFLLGNWDFLKRPKEATYCSPFFTTNPASISKTYGMPSGHSQTFAMIITLIILSLQQENFFFFIIKVIFLVFLLFVAMYMRVKIEHCHTFLQTIVGASIGIGLGFLFHKLFFT